MPPTAPDPMLLPNWLTAIGTLAAVVVALVIALSQDRRRWGAARVHIGPLQLDPPGFIKVLIGWKEELPTTGAVANWYWTDAGSAESYRLLIPVRCSKRTARSVELYAKALYKFAGDRYKPVDGWIPAPLSWIDDPYKKSFQSIAAGCERWCNLIHIVDPAERFRLGLECSERERHDEFAARAADDKTPRTPRPTLVSFDIDPALKTFGLNHIQEAGSYALEVEVSGENVPPRTTFLRFEVTGEWHSDQAAMRERGLKIFRQLDSLDGVMPAPR